MSYLNHVYIPKSTESSTRCKFRFTIYFLQKSFLPHLYISINSIHYELLKKDLPWLPDTIRILHNLTVYARKCLHLRYINCQHAVTLSTPCVSMYQYMCVHVHQGHSTHDWIHIKAVCVTCNVIRHHSNSSKPRLERKWKWGKKTLKQLQLFRNHKPSVNPTWLLVSS